MDRPKAIKAMSASELRAEVARLRKLERLAKLAVPIGATSAFGSDRDAFKRALYPGQSDAEVFG